jgi:hypothetical protein
MLNPKGYAIIVDPESPVQEYDTASCCHCGGIIFVVPGTVCTEYFVNQADGSWKREPGASCYRCMKPVCLVCYDKGTCTPLEKWLEENEKRRIDSAARRIIY